MFAVGHAWQGGLLPRVILPAPNVASRVEDNHNATLRFAMFSLSSTKVKDVMFLVFSLRTLTPRSSLPFTLRRRSADGVQGNAESDFSRSLTMQRPNPRTSRHRPTVSLTLSLMSKCKTTEAPIGSWVRESTQRRARGLPRRNFDYNHFLDIPVFEYLQEFFVVTYVLDSAGPDI
jgi:hypothetical protein